MARRDRGVTGPSTPASEHVQVPSTARPGPLSRRTAAATCRTSGACGLPRRHPTSLTASSGSDPRARGAAGRGTRRPRAGRDRRARPELPAGGLADRHDRRRTMFAVQALRVAAARAAGRGPRGHHLDPGARPRRPAPRHRRGVLRHNAQALVPPCAAGSPCGRTPASTPRRRSPTRSSARRWVVAAGGLGALALSVATGGFALAAVLLLLIPGTFRPRSPARGATWPSRSATASLPRPASAARTLSSMTALQHAGLAAVFT